MKSQILTTKRDVEIPTLLLVAMVMLACCPALHAQNWPTVTTDQVDYRPGTTATINGSGFQLGETVKLQVLNLTTPSDTGGEHDPWTVKASGNYGNFQTTWYVTLDETNQILQLTAIGLTSGLVAQRVFTDSVTATPANAIISADTAANAAAPAWTTLSSIKVSENNKADFSLGTNITFVLKVPTGWQFNTAVTPTTTFSGPEITAASTAITDSSTLTVTATVTDNNKFQDIFTISGIQVRPTAGKPLATGLQIYRPTTGGGNWIINGILSSTDGSSGSHFGALTETVGTFAGYTITGTSNTTAGISQNLTLKKTDQFGNSVSNSSTATLTFSGLGSVAANNPKINGATTAFSSGVSVAFASSGVSTTTLALIPYKAETATLNVIDGTKTSAAINGGLVLNVIAAAANRLELTAQPPASTAAGVTLTPSPVVTISDAFGNTVTTNTSSVTVAIGANPGSGTLSGTKTLAAVAGVATFSTLSINKSGAGYTLTFTDGALTSGTSSAFNITSATPVLALTSSQNPASSSTSVFFTAAVSGAVGMPTGTVRFRTNGIAFGSQATLVSGSATSGGIIVPRGATNIVVAEYSGDGNYLAATNTLHQVGTNSTPVAHTDAYSRNKGAAIRINIANLLSNDTDADGDSPLRFLGTSPTTTNGATITTNATQIYVPAANVNDTFTYTIRDGEGGTGTGTVTIAVTIGSGQAQSVTVSGATATVTFAAILNYTYLAQRATNLISPVWVNISTNTPVTNGVFSVTDNFSGLGGPPASAFYRLIYNP